MSVVKNKVRCIETGIVYDSYIDAAEAVHLKSGASIHNVIDKPNRTAGGYHWESYYEPDLPNEIWKNAKCWTNGILYDFTGRYLVSNKGRIADHNKKHIGYGSQRGVYKSIRIDGEQHAIHRIVATTFIPNPENKPTVDHISTDVDDNSVDNLRWATQKEQMTENEITRGRHLNNLKEISKKAYDAISIPVKCVETGAIYKSGKYAAEDVGLKARASIYDVLDKPNRTAAGYHWVSVKDEEE